MELSIRITQQHHSELMEHLHPGDGLEAVAFALCGTSCEGSRLLVHKIIPVPYDHCSVRSKDRVTWSSETLMEILQTADTKGFSIIKFHSHPDNGYEFSNFDDLSDLSLFPRIYDWLGSSRKHASVIVTPNGKMQGREVAADGKFYELNSIVCIASDITEILVQVPKGKNEISDSVKRVAQTFGLETFSLLGRLKIAVVGCSGTGSPVIEQLARTGVGELVLVDPDVIDQGNLNRITNSSIEDALNSRAKVDVLGDAIEKMGTGTKVKTYQSDTFELSIIRELSSCDAIFGCVDSIDGRHLLNKLATYYLIPYFDVGVKLVADGNGGINRVCGQVHYLQPGLSSLYSRGVYSMEQLQSSSLYRTNPSEYLERKKSGYIDGVNEDKPAVVSLNTLISSHAVLDFLSRIHSTRHISNDEVAITRFSHDQAFLSVEPEPKEPCSLLKGKVGLGDRPLLLDSPEFSEVMS